MPLVHVPPPAVFEDRRPALIAIQIVLVVAAAIVFALRAYTRLWLLRSAGIDDYIMFAALIFSFGLSANAIVAAKVGWGLHMGSVPVENFPSMLLVCWTFMLLFTVTVSLVKISILFFYLRIATTRLLRRVIYGSIIFIFTWMIAFWGFVIFQCKPVESYWDPNNQTTCVHPEIGFGVHGVTNIMTDFFVFFLPMRMVWKLTLPKRQRLSLVVIFGIGFVVCISGAIRLYHSIQTNLSSDSPWDGYFFWSWSAVETNLGIICASIPPLKALANRVFPNVFSGPESSSQNQGTWPPPIISWHSHSRKGSKGVLEISGTGTGQAVRQFGAGGGMLGSYDGKNGEGYAMGSVMTINRASAVVRHETSRFGCGGIGVGIGVARNKKGSSEESLANSGWNKENGEGIRVTTRYEMRHDERV